MAVNPPPYSKNNNSGIILLLCCLVMIIFGVQCAPANHLITNLPGAPDNTTFNQYSGYIAINGTNKNLFYWFVESQSNPSTDPVLIWMNGGPGASSLMGFFSEHGPFRADPDGTTLDWYPYAWNQLANIIYLETPCGVGFSYSNDSRDYITNDEITANDNYIFLQNWFLLYPEFKVNPFYVTGESYAGHYVPQLANLILENAAQNQINMQGIMVGNPGTEDDWYFNTNEYAFVNFLYSHGIIPQANYTVAQAACGWDGFLTNCDNYYLDPSPECIEATRHALIYYIPPIIDPYDIYAPVCETPASKAYGQYIRKWHPLTKFGITEDEVQFYPCIDNYMTSYLNQPDVQQAIHVNPTNWQYLGNITYVNESTIIIPLYQKFIQETNWRILVYSGDVDSAVAFLGTQRWINCLGQPIIKRWRPWYYNKQTAGFRQDFQGISYMTIKGAGHMVPYYLPAQGYAFFENWITEGPPFAQ